MYVSDTAKYANILSDLVENQKILKLEKKSRLLNSYLSIFLITIVFQQIKPPNICISSSAQSSPGLFFIRGVFLEDLGLAHHLQSQLSALSSSTEGGSVSFYLSFNFFLFFFYGCCSTHQSEEIPRGLRGFYEFLSTVYFFLPFDFLTLHGVRWRDTGI